MRHAARIKLDTESLATILGFKDGTVLQAHLDPNSLDLVVVVEHPSLPSVDKHEALQTVEPRGLGQ